MHARPASRASPTSTIGRWLMHVPWLERTNFSSRYSSQLAGVAPSIVDLLGGDRLVTTPSPRGDDDLAGVARGPSLHAGADDRRLGLEQRHGLALHVRAHQRAVGVVVLEERDQRRRHRDDLLGADVHVLDLRRPRLGELVAVAGGHALVEKWPFSSSAALACAT